MIEQLGSHLEIFSTFTGTGQKPVLVEAGHIYTDEIPSLKHETGAIVGAKVCSVLEEMGIEVQRMLFVDDYNAYSHDLDLDGYKDFLVKRGFTADIVIMESSLRQCAEEVIANLQGAGLTEYNNHGAVILKKNHKKEKDIVLRKSSDMGSLPACAALDTALYLQKAESAGICVTVLHQEWRGQQDGVKKVLRALGRNIPILEVYYSDEGEIEIDFEY